MAKHGFLPWRRMARQTLWTPMAHWNVLMNESKTYGLRFLEHTGDFRRKWIWPQAFCSPELSVWTTNLSRRLDRGVVSPVFSGWCVDFIKTCSFFPDSLFERFCERGPLQTSPLLASWSHPFPQMVTFLLLGNRGKRNFHAFLGKAHSPIPDL